MLSNLRKAPVGGEQDHSSRFGEVQGRHRSAYDRYHPSPLLAQPAARSRQVAEWHDDAHAYLHALPEAGSGYESLVSFLELGISPFPTDCVPSFRQTEAVL